MTTFTIPFPPTTNHIWKSSGKRRFLSDEYRAFKGLVAHIIVRERVPKFGAQRMAVLYEVCCPDKRRRDIANYEKAASDAFTECGVWDDDEQIDMLVMKRGPIVRLGCVIVTLEAL